MVKVAYESSQLVEDSMHEEKDTNLEPLEGKKDDLIVQKQGVGKFLPSDEEIDLLRQLLKNFRRL